MRAVVRDAAGVLLVRRAPGDRFSGHFELPGGKVDPGETPQQALARELHEETSLRLQGAQQLGRARRRVTPTGKIIREIVFRVQAVGEMRLSDEHDLWLRHLGSLDGLVLTDSARDALSLHLR